MKLVASSADRSADEVIQRHCLLPVLQYYSQVGLPFHDSQLFWMLKCSGSNEVLAACKGENANVNFCLPSESVLAIYPPMSKLKSTRYAAVDAGESSIAELTRFSILAGTYL